MSGMKTGIGNYLELQGMRTYSEVVNAYNALKDGIARCAIKRSVKTKFPDEFKESDFKSCHYRRGGLAH